MTITVILSVLLGCALSWLAVTTVRDVLRKRRHARKQQADKEASQSIAELLRASGYGQIADALEKSDGPPAAKALPHRPAAPATNRPVVDPNKLASYLRSGLASGGVAGGGSALESAATSAPPSIDAWADALNTAAQTERPAPPTREDIDKAVSAISRTHGAAPPAASPDADVPTAYTPTAEPRAAGTAETTPAAETTPTADSSTEASWPTPTPDSAPAPEAPADADDDDLIIDDSDDDLVARLRASAQAAVAEEDTQTWPGATKGTRQAVTPRTDDDRDVRGPQVRPWAGPDADGQALAPTSAEQDPRDAVVPGTVIPRDSKDGGEQGFRRWFGGDRDSHTPPTQQVRGDAPGRPAARPGTGPGSTAEAATTAAGASAGAAASRAAGAAASPAGASAAASAAASAGASAAGAARSAARQARAAGKPLGTARALPTGSAASAGGSTTSERGRSGTASPPPDAPRRAPRTSHRRPSTSGAGATPVFALGGLGVNGTYQHDGSYATVGIVTSGFSAAHDRLLELAVVLTDPYGKVVDEYATLINPGDRDLGATFLHGINPQDLRDAPTFPEIAEDLLALLEGAVVVAHHAEFVEKFLSAEFLRAGVLAPMMPALCTFRLSQQTIRTPNHRLGTIARHLTLPEAAGESALGDARIVATLLPLLIDQFGPRLTYPVPPAEGDGISGFAMTPPRPRMSKRPKRAGHHSWIATLMTRLPMSAKEVHDPAAAAYLEALTTVLSEGRVVRDEVVVLGSLLARTGAAARHIHAVSELLLESMRVAACTGTPLTVDELRHLRAAAASLSMPTYFDDLIPEQPALPPGPGSFARPVRKPPPPAPPKQQPRCAHCLRLGHYSPQCPTLGLGPASADFTPELTSGLAPAAQRQGRAAAQASAASTGSAQLPPDGSPHAPYDATITSVSSDDAPSPARPRPTGTSPWQSVPTRHGGTGPVGAVGGVGAAGAAPSATVPPVRPAPSGQEAEAWAEALRRHPGAASAAHLSHDTRPSASGAPQSGEDTAEISRLARLAAPPPAGENPAPRHKPGRPHLPGLTVGTDEDDDQAWY